MPRIGPEVVQLGSYRVRRGESSVSGLSSGAFMAVQLHLAHSASFVGAGVIAGGPYRCAESWRGAAVLAEDAYVLGALSICMNPLTDATAPDADHLVTLARQTAADGRIDDLANLADDRVYIFSGRSDRVVSSRVVSRTERFYRALGVPAVAYDNTQDAGHAIITRNPEDSPLPANQPPYINRGAFWQSHALLQHIYPA